ncbi:MAG: cation diffusion facilitator family transporter [Roseburia sp.]|nr:cation diffusion facilitator family transporter [Roseburia sp.]MCM1098504.1 cation diffusion facilitator family transporter [Ruminococcus flavefaciens]
MITFLARFFIKNPKDYKDIYVRQAYGVLCGAAGIFLNLCLFAGKFVAGFLSRSIAVTADAFNNLSDAGSSVITLIGFRMAGQKPDPDHPFGHGRIEYISGLLVSILILLMGIELIKTSVGKILRPEELAFSPLILTILIVSILVKYYMFLYNRKVGQKIDSAAMKVTGTDSLGDALSTAVVLIATLTSHFTGLALDGWCGVLVGLFVCYTGLTAARDTISPLLGQAPDRAFVQQVNDIVMSHPEILGLHDLIVHNYGPGRVLISLHAEVPADGNILTLHDVIDTTEHELKSALNCHAVIHMDPVQVGDEETERLKRLVQSYLDEISPSLSMHDFRIVPGPSHTNLIFDVVTPYDFPLSDGELIARLDARVRAKNPEYFLVVEVDKTMI